MLENEIILVIGVSLCFEFLTTNNQDEYEALIVGLTLATQMGQRILSSEQTHS